jgi:hypothetical protein
MAENTSKQGDNTFEFTNNITVMRFIRMFLSLQVIAIMLVNAQMPVLFRILSRDVLFYVVRFYSRPVLDLVYLFEYYRVVIEAGTDNINNIESSVTQRKLSFTSRYPYMMYMPDMYINVCVYVYTCKYTYITLQVCMYIYIYNYTKKILFTSRYIKMICIYMNIYTQSFT